MDEKKFEKIKKMYADDEQHYITGMEMLELTTDQYLELDRIIAEKYRER